MRGAEAVWHFKQGLLDRIRTAIAIYGDDDLDTVVMQAKRVDAAFRLESITSSTYVQVPRGLLMLQLVMPNAPRIPIWTRRLSSCACRSMSAPTAVCLRALTTLTHWASGAPSLLCPPQRRSSPPLRRARLRPEGGVCPQSLTQQLTCLMQMY